MDLLNEAGVGKYKKGDKVSLQKGVIYKISGREIKATGKEIFVMNQDSSIFGSKATQLKGPEKGRDVRFGTHLINKKL